MHGGVNTQRPCLCGEVELVSPVLLLAELRVYMTCPYCMTMQRGREMDHTRMHALATHPLTSLARFSTAILLSTSPNIAMMRSRRGRSSQSSVARYWGTVRRKADEDADEAVRLAEEE
jgi:hypothetical protein